MKYSLFTIIVLANFSFADYSKHPDAKELINSLVDDHKFERSYVVRVLESATKQNKILDAMSSPAEFTLTWGKYKKIFIEDKRIANGKLFLSEHRDLFDSVEDEFGVPREIIASILGVETRYGKIKGSHKVIDSLTTLGFDFPRRAKFFKSELIQFFQLTRENNLDIFSIEGSYAGAMGYGQFISSSYRAYAVDYDGDGYADLFNSVPDAVASIANYLKIHGWKRDGNVVQRVNMNNVNKLYSHNASSNKFIPLMYAEGETQQYIIQKGDSLLEIALNNDLSLKELMRLNNIKNQNLIKAGQIIILTKKKDIYFIGDDNFIAITKYNRSHFYAKAVYDLSLEF